MIEHLKKRTTDTAVLYSRVPLLIPFLLRPAPKVFRSVGLSCVIASNSAPSPALRNPFSLALVTKRINGGTLEFLMETLTHP
jgi:hypothetical protein